MKLTKFLRIGRVVRTFRANPYGGFTPYSKLCVIILDKIVVPIPFTEKEEKIRH
jgi:hypothetical protein